jgi:hypothetical protein
MRLKQIVSSWRLYQNRLGRCGQDIEMLDCVMFHWNGLYLVTFDSVRLGYIKLRRLGNDMLTTLHLKFLGLAHIGIHTNPHFCMGIQVLQIVISSIRRGMTPISPKYRVYCLCGLVVRDPGYRTEMYCVSCEVGTEFKYYVEESRRPLWSSGQSSWLQIQWS